MRFNLLRRAIGAGVLILIALLIQGCGGIAPPDFSGDAELLVARGGTYVEALTRAAPESLSDAEIIALGYVERARLGLGSPFRLIEYALHDPDLPREISRPLAYGILQRTLQGRTYYVDPSILDMARLAGVPHRRPAGRAQLELLERTIEAAPTAAAGERTVRLAYMLAGAERTVEPGYSTVTAHAAALLSDRRRAREDAALLLRSASARQVDPLDLLIEWRRNLRFTVELPSLAPVSVREEEAEARDGPLLALAFRALAQRQSGPLSLAGASTAPDLRDAAPLLDGDAAARLRALSAERNFPAQAPVAVAVAINREGFVSRTGLETWQREARSEFVEEVRNEEQLAAGAAALAATGSHEGQRYSLILLQAATFLRVWNQEDPWFPGDPAPSARDLETRFGLASVRFDDDVPEPWKPYYRRMLARSLGDLQRVMPTISVRGLNIHIGELPIESHALALHEPRGRTLYLPPGSGAGTIAHEIAHDLDWQLARRRYGMRGGYASDMAVRANRNDRIAAAMFELSNSLIQPGSEVELTAHATRPAEVFARGTDWLVAASLARDGRLGGYLSSFQDQVITGYGTTRGPDITGAAVPALISILEAVAPVGEETREWVSGTYGPQRTLTTMELAATVTGAGAGQIGDERLRELELVSERSFQAMSNCRFGSTEGLRRLVAAQHELARASLDAAARGAAIDAIQALAAERAGPDIRPTVNSWIAWRLYGAPEPVDPLLEELAPAFEDILLRAAMLRRTTEAPSAETAFRIAPLPSLCGGNPFAADSPLGRFRGPLRSATAS